MTIYMVRSTLAQTHLRIFRKSMRYLDYADTPTAEISTRGETHWQVTLGQSDGKQEGELLVAEPSTKTERPSFYKVVLLNDDYTPMDFVVTVLEHIFRKPHEEAISIMLVVHTKGAAAVGAYTRDVAETKVDQVIEYARINEYPLQCVIEKE
jgi:ATP-dependent Clp protease adaptor protein ClpS